MTQKKNERLPNFFMDKFIQDVIKKILCDIYTTHNWLLLNVVINQVEYYS